MFPIPTTKNNKIDSWYIIAILLSYLLLCLLVLIAKPTDQEVESTDKPIPAVETTSVPPMYLTRSKSAVQQWREAARPIFQSRGTIDITDRATPEDLKRYLDPCYAIVWQEKGSKENCTATGIWIKTK